MNQIVKDKMQREIMVVKNAYLFENIERKTKFYPNSEHDFENIIIEKYEYMKRGDAEVHFDYKQPIPYAAVIDEENKVFLYKRGGSGSNAGESRLHSKIAFGVGGHIEKEDEASGKQVLNDSLIREVEEELNISEKDIKSVEAVGYINDEESEVSKVHFGIFYIVRVHNSSFELLDGELDNGEFVSMNQLDDLLKTGEYDLENWSQILLEPLKKYLV